MKIRFKNVTFEYDPSMLAQDFIDKNEDYFVESYAEDIVPLSINNGENMEGFGDWCGKNHSLIKGWMEECYSEWFEANN